jgi:hypothetical protein
MSKPSARAPQVDVGWVYNERSRNEIRTASPWEWCPGEPNNANGAEDSTIMVRNCSSSPTRAGLNDVQGSRLLYPAICSKENLCTRK